MRQELLQKANTSTSNTTPKDNGPYVAKYELPGPKVYTKMISIDRSPIDNLYRIFYGREFVCYGMKQVPAYLVQALRELTDVEVNYG